jgi:hypothetical protein
MSTEERVPPEDDRFVEEEADEAGAEAAAIGGRRPDYDVDDEHSGDEAWRPLEEAGEGESEGFELAEHDLIEEASHGDEGRSPEADAFTPEVESDESGAAYGEADEEELPDE